MHDSSQLISAREEHSWKQRVARGWGCQDNPLRPLGDTTMTVVDHGGEIVGKVKYFRKF